MDENVFLLHSFLLGVGITFLYDILRILRRVFAHSTSISGRSGILDLLCGKGLSADVS
jgi:hypothetical protein